MVNTKPIWRERSIERADFRRRHPRRNGRRGAPFPLELEEMPTFAEWLLLEVEARKNEGSVIPKDVEDSSKFAVFTSSEIQKHVFLRVPLPCEKR